MPDQFITIAKIPRELFKRGLSDTLEVFDVCQIPMKNVHSKKRLSIAKRHGNGVGNGPPVGGNFL